MRRTTICRSERAALLALVAGLLAGLAPALAARHGAGGSAAASARADRGLSDDLRSAPHGYAGGPGCAAGLRESAVSAVAPRRVLRGGLSDRAGEASVRSCARQHVDPGHPAAHGSHDRDDVRSDLDSAAAECVVSRG